MMRPTATAIRRKFSDTAPSSVRAVTTQPIGLLRPTNPRASTVTTPRSPAAERPIRTSRAPSVTKCLPPSDRTAALNTPSTGSSVPTPVEIEPNTISSGPSAATRRSVAVAVSRTGPGSAANRSIRRLALGSNRSATPMTLSNTGSSASPSEIRRS